MQGFELLQRHESDPHIFNKARLLAREITTLKAARKDLGKAVDPLIAEKRRTWNSWLPIHHLPVEILVLIFQWVLRLVHLHQPECYSFHLGRLSLVSAYWREIVTTSPRFWTTVSDAFPPSVIATYLARSQSAPLALVFGQKVVDGQFYGNTTQQSLDLLVPEIQRWNSLTLIRAPRRVIQAFLPLQKTSTIRDLNVSGGDDMEILARRAPQLRLFDGEAPPLHGLMISNVSIVWKDFKISKLVVLKLHHLQHHCITTAGIIDILKASPRLQEFDLIDLFIKKDEIPSDHDEIHLPELRYCKVQGLQDNSASHILSRIHIPACRDLFVRSKIKTSDSLRIFQSFRKHFGLALSRIFSDVYEVNITLNSDGVLVKDELGPEIDQPTVVHLEISLPGAVIVDSLAWLANVLESAATPRVSFKLGPDVNLSDETLLHHLSRIPNVCQLDVGFSHRPFLFRLFFGKDQQWLFPDLTDLTLTLTFNGPNFDMLLNGITNRYEHSTWGDDDRTTTMMERYPLRLDRLVVRGPRLNRGVWSHIRQIVDQERTIWEKTYAQTEWVEVTADQMEELMVEGDGFGMDLDDAFIWPHVPEDLMDTDEEFTDTDEE